MQLRPRVPKRHGNRECGPNETFDRMAPHLARVGITRLADVTGLDRIGIPVFNAIIPRSPDNLSVYNGKGATAADARTSAVMEAVERFAGWLPLRPDRIAAYAELAAAGVAAIDPLGHNMQPHPAYRSDRPISWVRGVDLLNEESVLVPLFLAGYYVRFHELPCYRITTSNGIASGNTVEEAVCHGLMEVLERDDWTLADLVSNRLKNTVVTKLGAAAPAGSARFLEDLHRQVDLDTLPAEVAWMAQRIVDVGATLVVRDIRVDKEGGVPSFTAVIAEDLGPTMSPGHAGYGTHPDPTVAVARAITEAAQSRVTDIHGMREDLSMAGDTVARWNQHTQRAGSLAIDSWPFGTGGAELDFGSITGAASDDVAVDIERLLAEVRSRGLDRVVVVDLSPPDVPAHVVRVIVPGLEQWSSDQGKLGPRATARWDGALRELIARRDESVAATA
ncbi:YcaO-like family protein [Actinomycetes bacterium KLBMP 9759]